MTDPQRPVALLDDIRVIQPVAVVEVPAAQGSLATAVPSW